MPRPTDPELAKQENDRLVALMLRAGAGDDEAFGALTDHVWTDIYRICRRFLRNPDSAEDATQEVVLRIYRARERYRPTAPFRAWMYRICWNTCANHAKSEQRHRHPSLAGDGADPLGQRFVDPDARSPDELAGTSERRARIRGLVAELPEQQRMGLILHVFEGLSYEEIGTALDLSLAAVKSLLFRSRSNLKRKLEPFLIREGELDPELEL